MPKFHYFREMQPEKYVIVLGGATASGKTGVGIQLAKALNTEIISADSRQFYKEMNIGTAKPFPEELAAVKHHFIDSISITDPYNIGDFARDGIKKLEEIFTKKDCAILVGGSGLYIKALCEGLDVFPEVPPAVRASVEDKYATKGIGYLQKWIKEIDPIYAEKVDLNNPHRLIRAISVHKVSGQPYSSFLGQASMDRPFKVIYLCLTRNRNELYQRIDTRVDQMIELGQLKEAQNLYPQKKLQALQTVGYQELFQHLDGKITLEEAIELIKRNSRRYAKRQTTWFRKAKNWCYFRPNQVKEALNYINLVRTAKIKIKQISDEEITENLELYQSIFPNSIFKPKESIIACFKGDKIIGAMRIHVLKRLNIIRGLFIHSEFTNMEIAKILLMQLSQFDQNLPNVGFIPSSFGDLFQANKFKPFEADQLSPSLQKEWKDYHSINNNSLLLATL